MSQAQAKPKSEVNFKTLLISLAVGIVIALIPPPAGLDANAMRYMGIFVFMVLAMVLNALPTWAACTFSAVAMVGFKMGSFGKIFAEYAGSTVWMLLAIVGFASCLANSGLMKRIAFNVLKVFPPSYTGQVLAITSACVILTPLIPSSTAKLGVMAPFTASIAKETGIEPHSKGLKGLWFALFMTCYVLAFTVLTGSNGNFILLGFVPAESAAAFTWGYWFQACSVMIVVLLVGTVLVSVFLYKPEKPINMSKDFLKNQLTEMGPMTTDEKICAATLVCALVLWITASMHGISSSVVAWMALAVMVLRGLFTSKDVYRLPWTLIMFFASMMGVVNYMGESGVTAWLAETVGPTMSKLVPNAFVFVIVLAVFTWIVRLAVDSISILAITAAVFGPIASVLGINMWLVVWLTFMNGQQWILPHNQIQLQQSLGMMGGDILNFKDLQPLTWYYMAMALVGSLASIPLWTSMGLM